MSVVRFDTLRECLEYADRGGMGLYVYDAMPAVYRNAPQVFKATPKWGKLVCQDAQRLCREARRLGIRAVKIHRMGRAGQHLDLCGGPLARITREAVTHVGR